ncbi:MAG: hypothetical protein R3F39_01195 [Myxococcota bacterium]
MRTALALALALTSLAAPTARADEPLEQPLTSQSTDSAEKKRREFELGVQLYGGPNGSFLDEPSEEKKRVPKDVGPSVPYPGFAGVGGGGGLSVVGMWRGIVGLDLGFHVSLDQGHGKINGFRFDLSQTAVHIPILLRVAAPYDKVRPFLFVGPEIVVPTNPKVEVERNALTLEGDADTYVAVAFGFGFDIRLPTDKIDIRVPLMLRGSYTPSVSGYVADRVTVTGNQFTALSTTWQYQAMVTLGVAIYFL